MLMRPQVFSFERASAATRIGDCASYAFFALGCVLTMGCGGAAREPKVESSAPPAASASSAVAHAAPSFGDDTAFLRGHTDLVVLGGSDGPRVAVAPAYQGRVMTSTARGDGGTSYGFINREVVASGARQPHMNVFGGEDRFWVGPEGGQFGFYFPPGAPYDFDHWQVPEAIDWGAWDAENPTPSSVTFRKSMHLVNHSGTEFDVSVERTVSLLTQDEIAARLGAVPSAVAAVAYQSENTVTNAGKAPWTKDKGLLSVWILGMYQPSDATTIVLPFRDGPEAELGPIVNDAYFGKVPSSRLEVENGTIFFRGDGRERGKIGIPRRRARPIAGSYDALHGVLTIVEYTLPEGGTDYVNSMWEDQKQPYGGDVVNSYNDGPPGPGKKPLGPFYEIETSSPAGALAPGSKLSHVHRTMHLEGPREALDPIAKRVLGVGLSEIEGAFAQK